MRTTWLLILLINLTNLQYTAAQESSSFTDIWLNFPSRFTAQMQKKTAKLGTQLTGQTEKYLQRLARKEENLRRKLQKTDSTAAKQLFEGSAEQYTNLSEQLKNPVSLTGRTIGQYLPYVGSLKTSLSFLQQNSNLLQSGEAQQITNSLQQVQQLQGKLQQTEQIKAFIKQRKEQITL